LPSAVAPTRQDAPVLLDAAAVCEDLFRSGQTSFDVSRTFEERYQDRRVSWMGTLASVDTYSIDFAFGPEAGARATLDVHEIGGDAYGAARVQAIVRIPASAAESLRDARGSRIAFEGRLVRADSLLRQLYVADGRIVGPAA
jgi:hypothetical protein